MGSQKNFRRKLTGMLSVLTLVTFIVSACAPSAPTSATTAPPPAAAPTSAVAAAPPAAAPTSAAPEKVWTLKFATNKGPGHWAWPNYVDFKSQVEKESGGRIIIQYYPNESLVKYTQALDAVSRGIADVGAVGDTYEEAKMPLSQAFLGPTFWSSSYEGSLLFSKVQDKYFKENRDRLNLHQIGAWVLSSYWLFLKGKPAYKAADFKGMTLRSASAMYTKAYKAVGAIPLFLNAASDEFDALQKGIIDGSPSTAASLYSRKAHETGKPGYMVQPGNLPAAMEGVQVNKDVWDKLPKDLQDVLTKAGWDHLSVGIAKGNDNLESSSLEKMQTYGVTIIDWSPAEKREFAQILSPLLDEWGKEADGKGLRASELLAELRALAK